VLERARDVLKRLERYELDVFAEQATTPADDNASSSSGLALPNRQPQNSQGMTNGRQENSIDDEQALRRVAGHAGRQRLAAQSTLFEAINQSLLDELRNIDVETLPAEEARQLLLNIRGRIV